MENRNGLVVEATVTQANGTAEREAALAMVKKVVQKKGKKQRITLGADKGYDTQHFVDDLVSIRKHRIFDGRSPADGGMKTRAVGFTSKVSRILAPVAFEERFLGALLLWGGGRDLFVGLTLGQLNASQDQQVIRNDIAPDIAPEPAPPAPGAAA